MEPAKCKREIQLEIERARRTFQNTGRHVVRLAPQPEESTRGAKPRKQRLKMLA
jgi:hypothetical protein